MAQKATTTKTTTKSKKVTPKKAPKKSWLRTKVDKFRVIPVWQRAAIFAVLIAFVGSSSYAIYQSQAYTLRTALSCEASGVLVSASRNSRHDCVRTLQSIIRYTPDLNRICGPISIDQDFGPQTREALKCVQRTKFGGGNYSISADGVAGPMTFRKLKRICSTNVFYTPSKVPSLKQWCGSTGPYIGTTP